MHSLKRVMMSPLRHKERTCQSVIDNLMPDWETGQINQCLNHMADQYGVEKYRSGLDGEGYTRHTVFMTRCEDTVQEDGGDCVFYQRQTCCMGRCIYTHSYYESYIFPLLVEKRGQMVVLKAGVLSGEW